MSVIQSTTPNILSSPTRSALAPPARSQETVQDAVSLTPSRLSPPSVPPPGGDRPRPSADWFTNAARLRASGANLHTLTLGLPDIEHAPTNGFSETETNQDIDQTGYESHLVADLGAHVRVQNHQDISHLAGSIPTSSQLEGEFQKLAGEADIPFEYIIDGCYARAHLMCDQMMKDNINCAKMFVMLENAMGPDRLHAENKYMNAEWWYHVAPLTFAEDQATHQIQGYIMDPSMFEHPMKAEDWIHKMWDNQADIKIDVTRPPQYGPYESDGKNNTFEESLQPSHEVLAEYSTELAQIKDQYNHDHPSGQTPPANPGNPNTGNPTRLAA